MKTYYKLPEDLPRDIEEFKNDINRFLNNDLSSQILKTRRVPRGIYEQRKKNTFMIRVRIAGGLLNHLQAACLAKISREYGNSKLHLTTRQDIQLHDIRLEDTPLIMEKLKEVGLSSKGGGGNTVRNITACPLAGICIYELFDVSLYANRITEFLMTLPGSFSLPRKYKIALSGCEADCAYARINDLGLIAEIKDGNPGFKVYAAGGMGSHSRISELLLPFVPAKNVVIVSEALRRVFDRQGDRHNRSKARLRFVLERIGLATFKKEFENEYKKTKKETIPLIERGNNENLIPPKSNVSQPGFEIKEGLSVYSQKQSGYFAVLLFLPLGNIDAKDLSKLSEISEKYSKEKGFSTTQSQKLILRFVKEENLKALHKELKELETDILSWKPLHSFTACKGASTCKLGLCVSPNLAIASAEKLEKYKSISRLLKPIDIKISGCPNSCGHHPIGTIGLFGAIQKKDDRPLPSYKILLGAKKGEKNFRMGNVTGTLAAKKVPEFLETLLKDFELNCNENESFSDYCKNKGNEYFKKILEQFSLIPSYEDNCDFYRDWGSEEDFSLAGKGPGECGAGVFEIIQEDLKASNQIFNNIKQSKYPSKSLYEALLITTRTLLITRGFDSQNPLEIFNEFDKCLIQSGLVNEKFRTLLNSAKKFLKGEISEFNAKIEDIIELHSRVKLLFGTLDSDLKFHPPENEEKKINKKEYDIELPGKEEEYDLSGVACPMNFVKAKIKLESLNIGDKLNLILDEGEPVENVPASFKNEGQEISDIKNLENGHWKVNIKKVK